MFHNISIPALALIGLLLFPQALVASDPKPIRTVEGSVARVLDGDTVQVVTDNGTKLKVRLAGLDAPETAKENRKTGKQLPGQPYGDDAREFVKLFVFRKPVTVEIYGIDKRKRTLGFLFVDGKNLNLELVRGGLAEVFRGHDATYGPYKKDLFEAERFAKRDKRGMWSLGPDYESPHKFKKRTGSIWEE